MRHGIDVRAKIYVAGHTGLVGSAFMRALSRAGYRHVVCRTHDQLDLRRQAAVETFFKKERPTYVILAAARVGGILANSTYTAEFIYDNMMIGANVIDAAYRHGARRLLNLGSSCIYPRLAPQPLKESALLTGPLEPTNEPYAVAKIAAVKLCRYYHEQYGAEFLSVMPTNLYGPHDNYNLETGHVLPVLIRKFHLAKMLAADDVDGVWQDAQMHPLGFGLDRKVTRRNIEKQLDAIGISRRRVLLWGTGKVRREFLYVDDLIEACLLLLGRYTCDRVGEIINVGTGTDLTIRQIAGIVQKTVGARVRIDWDRRRPDGTPQKRLDISRIVRCGWQPVVDVHAGIGKTYAAYRDAVDR